MKLLFKKIILLIVLVIVFSCVPGYILDPYNVFHWNCVKSNGIEPNKNYIKMEYLLHGLDKYDSLMFGSSRVGAIHVEKITSTQTYNMTYSAGIPREHLQNIKTLLNAGMIIKNIYIGVDGILINDSEETHRTFLRCSFEYLRENPEMFVKLYCNPFMIVKSLYYLDYSKKRTDCEQMYQYGWWADYDMESNYNWDKLTPVLRERKDISYINFSNINNALEDIKEIVSICKENNINLVVFTNPMYRTTHTRALNDGYLYFLKKLSTITPFYNFSGINEITDDKSYYLDDSHYNAYVGDKMMAVLFRKEKFESLYGKGFGWYVTSNNIDKLIDIIDVD